MPLLRPRLITALALVASLSACQSPATRPAAASTPVCQAQGLDWAVGQQADIATLARLKQLSGAGILNPIGPASIVSKDYRADRLRVFTDASNRITAVRCG